ncbi:MAG: TolC family protein, partial [Gammaproteobacteria bacterium]|nr:TolC family protein [Gammaproteobacteria bacterium]
MRLPRLLPLTAALALVLALPAHAQSLVELYRSAQGYDATYQAARSQYDASVARAAQAKAGILPSVGLSGGVSRTELEVDTSAGGGSRGFNTQSAGINAT